MKPIVIAVLLSLSACGGGDGDGRGSIPIDDFFPRVTDAACSYLVRCGQVPDKAGCEESTVVRQQLLADLKAGKVIYDGEAAWACLDLYTAMSCKASEPGKVRSQWRSCRDTVKGTVSTGGACLTSELCQSEVCDKSACATNECCAGTCVDKILAGGDCSARGAQCADDLFCKGDGTAAGASCAALIADGEPCTGRDFCVGGRWCNLVTGTGGGTCGVLPARGEACSGMACDSLADFCDPASKTCVGRIAIGGDCAGFLTGCVPYANCDAATMKCVARKRAGEACVESSDCLTGVECTAGVCVPPADEPACM